MEEYISRIRRAQEVRVIDKAQARAATVAFRDDMLMSGPPSCSAANFKRPRLRRCLFNPATIDWSHSSRVGGGVDGYIWKVWFGEDGPYALKVFWDANPPDFHHYFAAQRECQNAALLQMLETAVQQATTPIMVNASPRTKDEALANLYGFSNEGRQMNTSAQGAHLEEIVTIPRIRKCYGWIEVSGHILQDLPKDLRPPVLQLVYEYVEEGENHPDVVEQVDKFLWLAGFSHSSSPAARNWKSGVLVDLSDIIHAGGYGCVQETEILKRSSAEAPYLFRARSKKSSPPRRKRAQDQLIQGISLLSSIAATLVQSYSPCNAKRLFGEEGYSRLDIQERPGSDSISVKIFLAIKRSDEKGEIQGLYRRICCYVFAKLHQKHKSIDPIVEEIENALQLVIDARVKVYHYLRIGAKWGTVLETFSSILNRTPQQVTGILCLLGSPSIWERTSAENHRSALTHMVANTDVVEKTDYFTPLVNSALRQLSLNHSFRDETPVINLQSSSLPAITNMPQLSRTSPRPFIASPCRSLHTAAEAVSPWKASSIAAVSETFPGSNGGYSEDASILLAFLSVLAVSEKVPLDLLSRGAAPRRRWNMRGEIEEVDAVAAGLAPEVYSLLSGSSRLSDAFHELELSSAVSKNVDETYNLDESIASRIRERLLPEDLLFFRTQALIVVYRAIPWKYIEPVTPTTKLFLPHLRHALQTTHEHSMYLPASVRPDLVLTLLEASRFPNMASKCFIMDQAEHAALGLEDQYIHSLIAQSRCLLNRILGTPNQTSNCLEDIGQDTTSMTIDNRTHCAAGQASIQRSLNCIQTEDLSTAKRLLEDWSPLHRENDLTFYEDFRDLICDLADTLRELNEPASAERLLRTEITRRDQSGISTGKSLLQVSLAEALFAQARYKEAESICLEVESRPSLLKLERLRLHITMAKIHHVESNNDDAFLYWKEAMKDIAKFHMTGGRTTRTILLSICHILRCRDQVKLMTDSMNQVALLDAGASQQGVEYWIAGLRHWSEYLDSMTSCSHV
ncbi:hypothetical protein F52700_11610 [Fusarium sp. NRRL 52700]|nr:hypothetical protein F52700_11610 [Fusarium sp. NRRL 52700]